MLCTAATTFDVVLPDVVSASVMEYVLVNIWCGQTKRQSANALNKTAVQLHTFTPPQQRLYCCPPSCPLSAPAEYWVLNTCTFLPVDESMVLFLNPLSFDEWMTDSGSPLHACSACSVSRQDFFDEGGWGQRSTAPTTSGES